MTARTFPHSSDIEISIHKDQCAFSNELSAFRIEFSRNGVLVADLEATTFTSDEMRKGLPEYLREMFKGSPTENSTIAQAARATTEIMMMFCFDPVEQHPKSFVDLELTVHDEDVDDLPLTKALLVLSWELRNEDPIVTFTADSHPLWKKINLKDLGFFSPLPAETSNLQAAWWTSAKRNGHITHLC